MRMRTRRPPNADASQCQLSPTISVVIRFCSYGSTMMIRQINVIHVNCHIHGRPQAGAEGASASAPSPSLEML